MPASRKDLFDFFDAHGIKHNTYEHAPVFTVEDSASIKADMPGAHTKNLFLKDKNGDYFLVCAEAHAAIRVNRLHRVLGCKRLSFGKPDAMLDFLGVTPGSVTLFGVLNDKDQTVTLIIDKTLADADIVTFHPLLNNATTAISSKDMIHFAKSTGHDPVIMDFSTLE